MIYLIFVSLIWAFSFGLIKTNLTSFDSSFVAFIRLTLSLIVFLPFLRIKNLTKEAIVKFIVIGAVQYGIMYLAYIYAYQFLKAYEVALFTIFTPLYVTIINDIIKKQFNRLFLVTSFIAVVGASVIQFESIDSIEYIWGFMLVQISNLCFAAGQIFYTKEMPR